MNKNKNALTRWMLTPTDLFGIVALITLVGVGLFFSIRDALQLGEAIDLSLTQTVVINQGVVNLQREIQLTHNEVIRLLGSVNDDPPGEITRFDFVKIQVNNLVLAVEAPEIKYIYTQEDLALVNEIQEQSDTIDNLITQLDGSSVNERYTILSTLDVVLTNMEGTVKQLIDRQSTTQRNAIIQTREALRVSQRTDIIAGIVLLVVSVSLAILFRRNLLARLHQAIEADEIKSQLVRNISHELRTPLAAIVGYTYLLDEDAYGPLLDEQRQTLAKVKINTTQLQGMVNNLLDSAQIEQGKLSIRKAPFAIEDLVQNSLSALDILAKNKGLELSSQIDADVPKNLIADKLRLEQILFNLVSNAIKFTETGSVKVRVFLPDSTHWAFQVTDTGIGIPVEAQSRVFDSFWQADSSSTRQYRGSGLGLSIVKQLTHLMSGKVSVQSEPGKGSIFTVTFPLEPKL
jgi:signal transduction histidine kinase